MPISDSNPQDNIKKSLLNTVDVYALKRDFTLPVSTFSIHRLAVMNRQLKIIAEAKKLYDFTEAVEYVLATALDEIMSTVLAYEREKQTRRNPYHE